MDRTTFDREYQTALSGCVLFDAMESGKIEVSGKDAPSFLHNLCTNDINNLPLGGGCEAYFCDSRAKALAHVFVYHVLRDGRHAFWLDVTPGYSEKVLKHLDKHLISEAVELVDLTTAFGQLHLAGPKSAAVLSATIGEAMPALVEFQHMERTIADVTCQIRCHDPLNLTGFDIVFPAEKTSEVRTALLSAGAVEASRSVFETLRIEAGTPIYGIDIDEDRFVMEVARALRAVSYSKGCYLGQEPIVMARDRAGFVNRAFLGVKVQGQEPLSAGTKLLRAGTEVGRITSCTHSPRLQALLALGYIRRGNQDPGLMLEAETTDGRTPVEVLPFPPVG